MDTRREEKTGQTKNHLVAHSREGTIPGWMENLGTGKICCQRQDRMVKLGGRPMCHLRHAEDRYRYRTELWKVIVYTYLVSFLASLKAGLCDLHMQFLLPQIEVELFQPVLLC